MYYSRNHEGLVFIDRGMGELEFSGTGILRAGDLCVWNDVAENWKDAFTTLTMVDGITEIGEGVLCQFPRLTKLCLPASVKRIGAGDDLRTLLRKNDVLIRAAYGTAGDAFAREHGLRFHPEDIELGWYRDDAHDESTKLILRFFEDGTRKLLYDIFTAGISAGSSGGASLYRDFPEDYVPGCTPEQFAALFGKQYYNQIVGNPRVKIFLERDAHHPPVPEQTE